MRKMYRFHFSPVIESATAGSTIRIFLRSSATGNLGDAGIQVIGRQLAVFLNERLPFCRELKIETGYFTWIQPERYAKRVPKVLSKHRPAINSRSQQFTKPCWANP